MSIAPVYQEKMQTAKNWNENITAVQI